MTAKELFDYLTNDAGLDEATAQAIAKAAANEKVGAKAASLKQQSEFDALQTRLTALQTEYEGTKDKLGAKSYVEWYNANFPRIQKLQQDFLRYQERYGALDASDPNNPNPNPNPAKPLSAEDVARIVAETFQNKIAPTMSGVIVQQNQVLQRHMRAGRKNDLDFDALSKIAAEKHGGNLVAAYEEWDKPEADRMAKEAEDKRVEERVQLELKKRNAQFTFPAGADAAPSTSISPLSRASGDRKYNRDAVVSAAITGEYGTTQTQ